jgi:hypothetical protein
MATLFGANAPKAPVRVAAPVVRQAPRPVAPKVTLPEPPPALVIQVINGAKATEQKFPAQGDRR